MRPDPVRSLLVGLAIVAAVTLGLVTHAPNRLVSGTPVGLGAALALPATHWPLVLGAASTLVLLAGPLLPRQGGWNWLLIGAAGLFAAALLWWAGACAQTLAARGA